MGDKDYAPGILAPNFANLAPQWGLQRDFLVKRENQGHIQSFPLAFTRECVAVIPTIRRGRRYAGMLNIYYENATKTGFALVPDAMQQHDNADIVYIALGF